MKIALTFDDGPNGEYTLEILKILQNNGIRACFFLLGKNVERSPDIALKIKQQGHLIGSHTYSHKHLANLTKEEILWQIEKTEEIFKSILGIAPKFIRMPYGESNEIVEDILKDKGYRLIGWNPRIEDHKKNSPKEIADAVVSKVEDGTIITLHDGANIRIGESRANTMKALPDIIKILKDRGFEFVRLDQIF